MAVRDGEARPLGRFEAPAASETGRAIEAELFHLRLPVAPKPGSEIEEVVWVAPEAVQGLQLMPLTRDHVLALARTL